MSSSTFLPGRTLRSHTSTSSGSGSENASQVPAALRNKLAAAQAGGNGVPAMGKRALLPAQRAALGDLGNNLRRQQQQPEKQAAKKPGRALTKQKATSELSRVVLQQQQQQQAAKAEPRRTRSGGQRRKDSLDEKENEDENNRMDVDEVFAAVPSHDTAHAMETSALDLVDALPADVEDIDAEDAENPQMATEYVNEIYAYMRQLEREMDVRKGYMAEKKTVLKPRMRNLMVDWLVDVHVQFSLLQETLYMCVGIMDRYFQVSLDKLSTRDVQLVGITCLFIAAKYEEMYPPELGDFEYITDKAYTQKQILRMEIEIIGALGFSLSRPLPLNFLRRNSKAGMVDAETHTLAKYAMEVALVDYEMAHFHPSVAAASALALALSIHGGDASRLRGELWNANLTFYTSYSVTDLEECLQAMAKRILAINAENTAEAIKEQEASKTKKRVNRAVFKKYSNKKFSKIALHPALTDVVMEELAAGNF